MRERSRFLFAISFLAVSLAADAGAQDSDGDGVPDVSDNCQLVPNPNQTNTNAGTDVFGNVCDGDYNNDGIVGVPDLNLLAQIFGTGANADMECADVIPGGFVIWLDDYMNCWLTQLGGAPGP